VKGSEISGESTVARYCGGSKLDDDGEPLPAAFALKEKEEYLSVFCLEKTGKQTTNDQVQRIREIVTSMPQPIDLKSKAKFALLNVGKVISHVRDNSLSKLSLEVLHEPPPEIHCGIHKHIHNNLEIMALIAECVGDTFPARSA